MSFRAGLMMAVKAPLWSLSVLTGAKSFVGNPVIGSERLTGWACMKRACAPPRGWRGIGAGCWLTG